jgi:solute carrier family 50 (sugar transporter)
LIRLDRFLQLPNVLGFTFGVVQMALYMFYMNKTPVGAEGKDAGKLPTAADEHIIVNIAKLSPALPEKSSEVHPVAEMTRTNCATQVAMAENRDFIALGPAVRVT